MQLLSPEWLILIPAALVLGIYFKGLRIWTPLRILMLLLLIFALARPRLASKNQPLDLWVLVDHSASAAPFVTPQLKEWEGLLERSRKREDRIHYVDFADSGMIRAEGDAK